MMLGTTNIKNTSFCLLQNNQTGSEAQSISNSVDGLSLGVQRRGV